MPSTLQGLLGLLELDSGKDPLHRLWPQAGPTPRTLAGAGGCLESGRDRVALASGQPDSQFPHLRRGTEMPPVHRDWQQLQKEGLVFPVGGWGLLGEGDLRARLARLGPPGSACQLARPSSLPALGPRRLPPPPSCPPSQLPEPGLLGGSARLRLAGGWGPGPAGLSAG